MKPIKLKDLAPWQIITAAVVTLIVFLFASYFLVVFLTTTKAPGQPQSSIPTFDQQNDDVVRDLESFEKPEELPNLVEPLRPADPNQPDFANPF